MTLSNSAISGHAGDVVTLNGTLTASADISLIPGSTPSLLTSSVLALGANRITVNSLAMNGTYTGPIVDVQISPSATPGPYPTNSFQLSFDDDNGRTQLTSANVTLTVIPPPADLSVTKNGPAGVTAGQSIVYSIVVTNNGPNNASGVIVTDPAPAGATFVSNSGGCTTAFPCNLGTLLNGQSATITATYNVSPGTANGSTIVNAATVSSGAVDDATPGNNTAIKSSTVSTSADLSITKIGPPTVITGTNSSYTITVSNAGPSNSSNVVVTDAIPGNTSFVSATPSQGSCSGTATVTCSLGTINAGSSATITLVLRWTSGNSVTNTASVAAGTADPNLSNNSSVPAGIAVTPAPSSLILILGGLGMLILYEARRRLTAPSVTPSVVHDYDSRVPRGN